MRKLTLQLDSLAVDSFETGANDGLRGTVRGRDTLPTEMCATPVMPCKPTTGCTGPTSYNTCNTCEPYCLQAGARKAR
jgi:hypothetical protein